MTVQPSSGSSSNASVLDETTPLLAASALGPTNLSNEEAVVKPRNSIDPRSEPTEHQENRQKDDENPLPLLQIFLLCYARLVEPVACFCIFPFINQMIKDTGDIDNEDVGFYSGVIESLFSLTQMFVMIPWGRASDRIGRKPVLCLSLFGMTFTTAIFGLSQSIWQMILFRCLAGVFAGTVVTVRTMISENSTQKTQARAFSFFAFASNLGIFLGPLLGGLLAQPAKEYSSVFGGVRFFVRYPYALPTFAAGAISLSAAILSTLLVKETLRTRKESQAKSEPPMSTWNILNHSGVGMVIYILGHASFLGVAYTAVAPVFWFEPVYLGGFGFSPRFISVFLALGGFAQALWLLLAFPPLQKRYGTGGVLRACTIAWPIFFLENPILNILLKHGWKLAFWIIGITSQLVASGVAMAFIAVQLALNDISPSSDTLGTLNALALALASGIRAVTPAAFSSLYAIGVKYQILDGELIWLILTICAIAYIVGVRFLPARAEGKIRNENSPS